VVRAGGRPTPTSSNPLTRPRHEIAGTRRARRTPQQLVGRCRVPLTPVGEVMGRKVIAFLSQVHLTRTSPRRRSCSNPIQATEHPKADPAGTNTEVAGFST
jgi:hypothetical protein